MSTSPRLDHHDPSFDLESDDRDRDQSPSNLSPRSSHPLDPRSSTVSELGSFPAHAAGDPLMNQDQSAEPSGAPQAMSAEMRQPSRASPFSTAYPPSNPSTDSPVIIPSSFGSGSSVSGASTTMSYVNIGQMPLFYATAMRDAPRSGSAHFPRPTSPLYPILIRRLPLNTSTESVRLMAVFSQQLADVELLPLEQSSDAGFITALLKFRSQAGAVEAQKMLHGRTISNDGELIVEILQPDPRPGHLYGTGEMAATPSSSVPSAAQSSTAGARQMSLINGPFPSLETLPPPTNGIYTSHELPNPDTSTRYQNLFSPQSPIGNHVTERGRISGKTLIANDSGDDEDTNVLLKDPVAYAEYNDGPRRKTDPGIPVQAMNGLSINTKNTAPSGPSSLPPHIGVMSPQSFQGMGQPQHRSHFPPVNPADQNPPCNTLYVGNLPIDTSEEELKALFSKQRGYKRLCFRTKGNGPMCFVEFEDTSFATKALNELYGQLLHNSVKGGIRLSFSKNPLGVRSNPNPNHANGGVPGGINAAMSASANGFVGAHRPPPGLAAPPGLGGGRQQPFAPAASQGGALGSGFPNPGNFSRNASIYAYNGHAGAQHNGVNHVNGANSIYPYNGHVGAESNGMNHVNGVNSMYAYHGYEPNGVNSANGANGMYPYNGSVNTEPRGVNGANSMFAYNGHIGADPSGANLGNGSRSANLVSRASPFNPRG